MSLECVYSASWVYYRTRFKQTTGEHLARYTVWLAHHQEVHSSSLESAVHVRAHQVNHPFGPAAGQHLLSAQYTRWGYCSPGMPPFEELCQAADQQLFSNILTNSVGHLLHRFLPPQRRITITFISAHTIGN